MKRDTTSLYECLEVGFLGTGEDVWPQRRLELELPSGDKPEQDKWLQIFL